MITVTREDVLANMQDVIVKTVVEFDKPCTYVTVRMKNGFTLRESTTCVDPANYNEEIGKEICSCLDMLYKTNTLSIKHSKTVCLSNDRI